MRWWCRGDHLRPRVSQDGQLYFIRRLYELPSYSPKNIVDLAVPLPGAARGVPLPQLLFDDVHPQAAHQRQPPEGGSGLVPSLVPADWQLVGRSPQGEERVLASSVASYDIGPDGAVVYTNRRGVFAIETDGATKHALTAGVGNDVMVGG